MSAVCAAVRVVSRFDSVSDDSGATFPAGRGEARDCTLEAVERVRLAFHLYDEALIVVISALLTDFHFEPP